MHLYLDFNASYLAAFVIGLFSSLHCIGMCGSIIGTLTYSLSQEIRNNKRILFSIVLSYNLGRIASYALAGAAVGTLQIFLSLPFTQGQAHRILQLVSALILTGAGICLYRENGLTILETDRTLRKAFNTCDEQDSGAIIWHGLGLAALRFDLHRIGSGRHDRERLT
jgi:sulfite exporter TauE/SafE